MRIFFVILWVSNLLISTVGVNLHRIYCYCTEQTTLAFWQPLNHACDTQGETAEVCLLTESKGSCCAKVEKKSCCAKPEKTEPGISVASNCMDDQQIYVKLSTDLHLEKYTQAEFALVPDQFISPIFHYPAPPSERLSHIPLSFRGPPLKPFGRWLLPHIQLWLC